MILTIYLIVCYVAGWHLFMSERADNLPKQPLMFLLSPLLPPVVLLLFVWFVLTGGLTW